MATPKLFTPVQVGNLTLQHRIVLAPLTRIRAKKNHVHNKIAVEYYSQRASTPGTLLITEDTIIAPQAGGANNVPGIWNDEQIAIWKEVVNAVHSKGSFIYLQLWTLGRLADPSVLEEEGPYPYVSASDVKLSDKHAALYISAQGERVTPRPLTTEEIKQYVHWYAIAASNAVHKAGFDGVEIHAAGGNLIDQFLQDVTNKRTDQYGGTIENRARFALEVVDAVVGTIGARRMGIKIGPWAEYNGTMHFRKLLKMRMQDPVPTFTYLVQQLASRYSDMAYLHVTEPRVNGEYDTEVKQGESNDFIRQIWAPRPYVSTGGYDRALALDTTEKNDNELIAFGRRFISNPDLVLRLKKNLPLAAYDRSTFYTAEAVKGYLDYPIADENKAEIGLV